MLFHAFQKTETHFQIEARTPEQKSFLDQLQKQLKKMKLQFVVSRPRGLASPRAEITITTNTVHDLAQMDLAGLLIGNAAKLAGFTKPEGVWPRSEWKGRNKKRWENLWATLAQ